MPTLPSYVIVTPARNEAEFIELTLQSVVSQSVRPLRWVIVSDGSTDGTDEIVARYSAEHPWIKLVRTPERAGRNFASKVFAFNAGYGRLKDLDYQVIVSLDADISFDGDYFQFLIMKLAADPLLGVTGTPFQELSGRSYNYRFVSIEHVSGACQIFRRECFEAIGGYTPVTGGSIDHIAVISSRMKGWKTRTYTEKVCIHHREMGTAQQNALGAKFRYGIKDYAIGNHPVWELFRAGYQMVQPPLCLGGLALGAGYMWAMLRRFDRPVPQQLITFNRQEQMRRLMRFFGLSGTRPNLTMPKASDSGQPTRILVATSKSTPDRGILSDIAQKKSRVADVPGDFVGSLIVNADDWGRNIETTDRILECITAGTVSSTSAMVFMEDSERGANLARGRAVDCGLHLNFTTPFTARGCPLRLREHQERVGHYLRRNRLAQTVYHPGLASSFKYVAATQIDEFERIFGGASRRFDGHHHMHLCANVLFGRLLPAGTIVRKNFSFRPHEKGRINWLYRQAIDRVLAKRYRITDFFFSLPPLEPQSRIDEIFSLARRSFVELETHPANPEEYRFLTGGEILRRTSGVQIAREFALAPKAKALYMENLVG